MNSNLKPYAEYKEAKQSWIKKVPIHWKEAKSKRLFLETSIKNHPTEELLSATQSNGVIPRSMLKTRVVMPSGNLETFKLVKEGNFVISLRSFQGGLEYSRYRGIVSPAYNILEERTNQNKEYYRYLFKSHDFIGELQRNVTGIRQGKNIDVNDFKEIILPIPSLTEQDNIVKYLDHQLAKIKKFIKAKKKLITVLKEQKQLVINDAVTKGLNQNVKMQPTNINFIESVPAHWRKYRLKNLVSINGRIGFRGYTQSDIVNEGEGAITLSPGNIKNQKLKLDSLAYISWDKYYESPEIMVEDNDILLVKTGSSFGKAILIKNITYPMTINPQLVLLKKCKAHPEYFEKILFSSMFMSQISRRVIGGATPTIGQGVLGDIVFYVPDLNEQKHIIEYINHETDKIDKSIATIEKEIELITEFRTSLISNVVTGKLDVRDILLEENGEVNAYYEILEDETMELEEVLEGEECEV
ncbi:restriction endonuclease subunit S [Alkalihalobacillus pseudalcaliphilus]|uniref:restriction endonuclease subunit S n=1 Tax=Alkalihalobacillus pseudalcaliphilus TaxID=79884 RepID=UPI00064DCA2D|nr:restriction endonuclease subunit S [Alkalihalobacillus pseudalcaliphilus]KMK77947.1 hypothetical protein AB990_00345 [Alkalihalobacillus pseudalcaliphilus]